VTNKGRGHSQQPAAQSGMTHNNVQRGIGSRQEFDSDFIINDVQRDIGSRQEFDLDSDFYEAETFPEFLDASNIDLT